MTPPLRALHFFLLLLPFTESLYFDVRNTSLGAVRGVVNDTNHCRSWRGIFFAADTGGENRFRKPQPRNPWEPTVLDATKFGAGCLQIDHNPDVPTNQSEDCLSLNVFAPEDNEETRRLPVLIFFHGGTFKEGWSEGPFDLYDGCNMAQGGNVILVTANYRLGALGFAVTTAARRSQHLAQDFNLRGQFGLYDQLAAMEWVRDNIAEFGGNPSQVTIFGQSAGSMSVGLHYVSPASFESGLFHRVIMESNYPGSNLHSMEDASKLGNDFCRILECFAVVTGHCDVECMRSQNASMVQNAWRMSQDSIATTVATNSLDALLDSIMAFAPVIDGDLISCKITDCLMQGSFNPAIDAMFGTMSGDGATFIYYLDKPIPYGLYEDAVKVIWRNASAAIFEYYDPFYTPPLDGRVPLAQVLNDYLFRCSSEVYGREIVQRGGSAYSYVFDYVWNMAWLFPEFGLPDVCTDIACHSEEIPFVFNNTVPSLNASFTAAEQALAANMVTWWTNFARNGDPNNSTGGRASTEQVGGTRQPLWPHFTADGREAMHIALESYVESGGVDLCAGMWDGIGYLY